MTARMLNDGTIVKEQSTGRRGPGLAVTLLLAVAVFLALLVVFWVGFLGSDDALYWEGAGGWLRTFPYVGTSHWTLRHTMVIPMALARWALGPGMPALLLPTMLYGIGAIALIGAWAWRAEGRLASVAALALVVTNPQFVLLSSSANIDIVEMFFIVASLVLLQEAMERLNAVRVLAMPSHSRTGRGQILALLVLAGISAGMAMLSRETTVLAVASIGLLFLVGYGMPRTWYLFVGGGFAAVVGLEFVYLWRMTGTLFYRASISLHHDSTIDRWVPQGSGVPLIHPVVDPVTMLLLNHNFGLVGWVAVPVTVWYFRRGLPSAAARTLAVLAVTLALTWTVIAGELWVLLPLTPRYFLLPSVTMSMVIGIALARMWSLGRHVLSGTVGAVLLAANLLALSLDNRNYMYGEHELVAITSRTPGPIHTDGQTWRRALLLLQWKGLDNRVTPTPPGPGDLFYDNPSRAAIVPAPDWTVVERHGLGKTFGEWTAFTLLPKGIASPWLLDKLGSGHPDVALYRLP